MIYQEPNFLRLLSSLSSPSVLALDWINDGDDRAPNGPSTDDDDDLTVSGGDCITWGDDRIDTGGDDLMVRAGDCAGDQPM